MDGSNCDYRRAGKSAGAGEEEPWEEREELNKWEEHLADHLVGF